MLPGWHNFLFPLDRRMAALYFALGLFQFAEGLLSIFIPIYFYRSGFTVSKILIFYTLISVYFVALVFIILPLLKKLSNKAMMLWSILPIIGYYLGLGFVLKFPFLFAILPFLLALYMLLFNVGYHLDFSDAVRDGYVGREVGLSYVAVAVAGFLSPLTGGVLIGVFGFQVTFVVGSLILFLAIIPLFFFPSRTLAPDLQLKSLITYLKNRSLFPFNLSGAGYAMEEMVVRISWPLFLFLLINDFEKFGAVISLGVLAGAAVNYLSGLFSDAGRRRKILSLASWASALLWLSRIFLRNAGGAALNHLGRGFANSALLVSWSSQYYKIARALPDPGAFILSRELLYHLARVPFLLILAWLAAVLSLGMFFKVSFFLAALSALLFLAANRFHTENFKLV